MGAGGARIGAGKKKGSVNKRTLMLRNMRDTALAAGISPLEVMLKNMRFYDEKADLAEKLLMVAIEAKAGTEAMIKSLKDLCMFREEATKCASYAAPYCHPHLSSIEVSGHVDSTVTHVTDDMTAKEAADAYASTLKHDARALH